MELTRRGLQTDTRRCTHNTRGRSGENTEQHGNKRREPHDKTSKRRSGNSRQRTARVSENHRFRGGHHCARVHNTIWRLNSSRWLLQLASHAGSFSKWVATREREMR